MKLSKQQQLAVDGLGKNIIVSASAGAGKTMVLISRLMKRILVDGVSIDEVIALTFTEKAAKEMKDRLLSSLHQANQKESTPFLRQQISLVETASITTIHAFCLELIKNYGYVVGINPTRYQNVMDESQVKQLKDRAYHLLMNQLYREEWIALEEILDIFSASPIQEGTFKSTLFSFAQYLNSQPDPITAIEEMKDTYSIKTFSDIPVAFQELFFAYHYQYLNVLKDKLSDLEALSLEGSYKNEKKEAKMQEQSARFQIVLQEIEKLIAKVKNKDISFYEQVIDALDFKIEPDKDISGYKDKRDSFEKEAKKYVSTLRPMDTHIQVIQEQKELVVTLLSYADRFNKLYSQIKEDENMLDFDDFETLAYQILNYDNGFIANMYKNKYKEIMVDEFQDTNYFQNDIITSISNGFNTFRVGDVKQSIYRFRGAKPQIMQEILRDETTEKLFLSSNYRSKASVVNYNNHIFESLLGFTTGMEFQAGDLVEVGTSKQSEDVFPVELHYIYRDKTQGVDSPTLHAHHIAQEIKRLHENGYKFKDMMILVRNHANKTYLKEVLSHYNIPHYMDDQQGFYQSEIIQNIISFLKYAQTKEDYYLVETLLSPFFDCSLEDIANFKIKGGTVKKGMPKELVEYIDTLCQNFRDMSVVDIIQTILNLNDTYSMRLNIQDKTNMDALLEKSLDYQNKQAPTLDGFIQFLEVVKDESSSEASSISEEADVVSAMTMHQSKGLQFPIVFVWGTGSHKVQDHTNFALVDSEFGITMNHMLLPERIHTKSLYRVLVEFKQDSEELEENLRLLYVALTRPESKLIITTVGEQENITTDEFIKEVPKLNYDLLRNHTNKMELLLAAGNYAIPVSSNQKKFMDSNTYTIRYIPDVMSTIKVLPKETEIEEDYHYPTLQLKEKKIYENKDLVLQDGEGMKYGSILHEAIESLPHTLWNKELEPFSQPFKGVLSTYNQNPMTQKMYGMEIMHETPFITESENGIIDFLAINEKEVYIIDFKSDNASSEELVDRYTDQINRYKEAIEKFYPKHKIYTYIYSFKLNEYIKILDK